MRGQLVPRRSGLGLMTRGSHTRKVGSTFARTEAVPSGRFTVHRGPSAVRSRACPHRPGFRELSGPPRAAR
jgi:hypothetical protein